MLPLLHTISGWLIIVALVAKILLHYWLDYLHKKKLGLLSVLMMPQYYLGGYKSSVASKYLHLKRCCNILVPIASLALVVNILVGLLQLYAIKYAG